jgi:predicted phage-related endonuclease
MLPRVGRLRWATIERAEEAIEEHVEVCRDFWQRVENGEPPEADGHRATGRALRRLYPGETGETIDLNLDDALDTWLAAKAARKEQDRAADAAENELRRALGTATFGQLPSGRLLRLAKERKNAGRILRLVGND